jgi:hypothetical protein
MSHFESSRSPHLTLPVQVNRPEYEVDFSFVYHLGYDDAAASAAARMRAGVGLGDRAADGSMQLDGGAGEFSGRGAGAGAFLGLAALLPANPPASQPRASRAAG